MWRGEEAQHPLSCSCNRSSLVHLSPALLDHCPLASVYSLSHFLYCWFESNSARVPSFCPLGFQAPPVSPPGVSVPAAPPPPPCCASASAVRPFASASVLVGVSVLPTHFSGLVESRSQVCFMSGSPPAAMIQPNSVLLEVSASQHLHSLESSERFLQPERFLQALLSWSCSSVRKTGA